MFKDEVTTVRFNQVKFGHVYQLPLSLSDSFLEVTGSGDQKTLLQTFGIIQGPGLGSNTVQGLWDDWGIM